MHPAWGAAVWGGGVPVLDLCWLSSAAAVPEPAAAHAKAPRPACPASPCARCIPCGLCRAFDSMLGMAAAAHIVTGVVQRRPALVRQAGSLLQQARSLAQQSRAQGTLGVCRSTTKALTQQAGPVLVWVCVVMWQRRPCSCLPGCTESRHEGLVAVECGHSSHTQHQQAPPLPQADHSCAAPAAFARAGVPESGRLPCEPQQQHCCAGRGRSPGAGSGAGAAGRTRSCRAASRTGAWRQVSLQLHAQGAAAALLQCIWFAAAQVPAPAHFCPLGCSTALTACHGAQSAAGA